MSFLKISAKEDVDHWFFSSKTMELELKNKTKIKFSYFSNVCMIEMNTREQELAYLIVKNSSVTWWSYLGRLKVGEGTVLILQFEKS
jgi:hypothetical protein